MVKIQIFAFVQVHTKKKYIWQRHVMEEMVMLDTADLRNFIAERWCTLIYCIVIVSKLHAMVLMY